MGNVQDKCMNQVVRLILPTYTFDDISLFGGLSSSSSRRQYPNHGTNINGRDSDVGGSCSSLGSFWPDHVSSRPGSGGNERRRRRLPEIPKNKKCK